MLFDSMDLKHHQIKAGLSLKKEMILSLFIVQLSLSLSPPVSAETDPKPVFRFQDAEKLRT